MKKLVNIYILSFFAVFTLSSCDDEDLQTLEVPENGFVYFDGNVSGPIFSASTLENNSQMVPVRLLYSIYGEQNESFSVPFSISGTDASNYEITGGDSFVFEPGEYSSTIYITPVNNVLVDGDREVIITLGTPTNGAAVGFEGTDANNSQYSLTIVDDDCAYTLEELGNATWSGSDNATGDQGPNASQITTSFDGTNLLIEGIAYGWLENTNYWDEVVVDSFPVVAEIAADGSITIAYQPLANTTWVGDPQTPYFIEATGMYEACSERMTINYDLYQGGAILTSFTEVITKN